jgi:O-antigen/teichoic acid export membrane protein
MAVQHQALLRRRMQFGSLAWISIGSTAGSIIVGIALAWWGMGYWALVLKEVSGAMFGVVGAWLLCHWMPGLPKRNSGVRSILRFGRDVTGFDLIFFLSRNLDQILIGRFWGATPLGYYRQAHQLMAVPVSQLLYPISHVAEPTLSALQHDGERYRKYYLKMLSILSFGLMPLAVYAAIFSECIVQFLLGPNWLESAGIFRILAIAAFISPLSSTCGFVMVTCGKTRRYFWLGVLSAASLTVAFFTGIAWGPLGVATAVTVSVYLLLLPTLWYSFRDTPITPRLFFGAIFEASFASLAMGMVLVFFSQWSGALSNNIKLAASLVLAIASYCCIWAVLPGGAKTLLEYASYPLEALGLKRKSY